MHPCPSERRPSPNLSAGRPASSEALTEEQRQFATERHSLIYSYLREKGWDDGEYYDIAAFGFLRAVKRYLTEPKLRQYAFSTIAWRAMGQSVASFHRAEARRLETEQRYWETRQTALPQDPMEELEADLIL